MLGTRQTMRGADVTKITEMKKILGGGLALQPKL
jgi:hypothetical protein